MSYFEMHRLRERLVMALLSGSLEILERDALLGYEEFAEDVLDIADTVLVELVNRPLPRVLTPKLSNPNIQYPDPV